MTSTDTEGRLRARTVRMAGLAASGTLAITGLAACGGHHRVAAPPTTTTTTTIATTTTRPAPPPTAPLTGLPQKSAKQLRAPAVVVKIDNIDAARPQTGINSADIVYEELVEGGLTRLAAVFQSHYPTVVGPVRSGRLTDEAIADDLNHPVLAYSGTNAIFLPLLEAQPVTSANDNDHPELFYRAGSNPAPHNLYSSVLALAGVSSTHAPPLPLFHYRARSANFKGAGVTPADQISIGFPDASVMWRYKAGDWFRWQNGTADVDNAGGQIQASNVVVMFVNYFTSAYATGEGGPPAPIPEGVLTGSGQAWFLSARRMVKGTWSRPNLTTRATYLDLAHRTIELAPGRTWIELVPVGSVPTVTP